MSWAARALHWRAHSVCGRARRGKVIFRNLHRDWDGLLKVFDLNEEFLVCARHHPVQIRSLPFVHTARRSYRLGGPVNNSELEGAVIGTCDVKFG